MKLLSLLLGASQRLLLDQPLLLSQRVQLNQRPPALCIGSAACARLPSSLGSTFLLFLPTITALPRYRATATAAST